MTTKMLDQKIEKLKERVDKAQAEYDALAKELKELMDKRKTIIYNSVKKKEVSATSFSLCKLQ